MKMEWIVLRIVGVIVTNTTKKIAIANSVSPTWTSTIIIITTDIITVIITTMTTITTTITITTMNMITTIMITIITVIRMDMDTDTVKPIFTR
jgi:hypothetical protein